MTSLGDDCTRFGQLTGVKGATHRNDLCLGPLTHHTHLITDLQLSGLVRRELKIQLQLGGIGKLEQQCTRLNPLAN